MARKPPGIFPKGGKPGIFSGPEKEPGIFGGPKRSAPKRKPPKRKKKK